jgi:hypothetical protein
LLERTKETWFVGELGPSGLGRITSPFLSVEVGETWLSLLLLLEVASLCL